MVLVSNDHVIIDEEDAMGSWLTFEKTLHVFYVDLNILASGAVQQGMYVH